LWGNQNFNAATTADVDYYVLTSSPSAIDGAINQIPLPRLIAYKTICVSVFKLTRRADDVEDEPRCIIFEKTGIEHVMPLSFIISPDEDMLESMSRHDYIRTSIHTQFLPADHRGDRKQIWYYKVREEDVTKVEQLMAPVVIGLPVAVGQRIEMDVLDDVAVEEEAVVAEENEGILLPEVEEHEWYECSACSKRIEGQEIPAMQECPNLCGTYWICSNKSRKDGSCLKKQALHSKTCGLVDDER